jgi:ABC-2 type transport system permease protein
MFEITNINNPNKEKNSLKGLLFFLEKISGGLGILFILGAWVFIFLNNDSIFGLERKEIITYILVANMFGLVAGTFLHRVLRHDINKNKEEELLTSPFKYLFKIIKTGFWINTLPFVSALVFNFFLIYFFVGDIDINLDPLALIVIALIIFLSFIIQVLMFFIARLFAFWSFESVAQFKIAVKFKKILAGAYFPLSILPPLYLKISLMLPFAYGFFVPTELLLKKMNLHDGLFGIWIEILWIIILYAFIKVLKKKKI